MVSSVEPQHVSLGKKRKLKIKDNTNSVVEGTGKKRKLKMKDNTNSVVEGDGPKEIQMAEDAGQMVQSVESVDRISELPNHVIHHILSFLRNVKDAIRTRSLSKRWRTMWFSFAALMFYEQKFVAGIGPEDGSNKENLFRQHVADSLHTYLANNAQIHKFLLHMTSFDLTDAPLVDSWLTSAVSQDIKEIDLQVGFKDSKLYTLPEVVLSSETLTGLRLSGCILQSFSNIMLPRLQKLYLRKIHLSELILLSLISRCPSIEDLRLIQCSGLKFLCILHPSLSRVDIHNCNQLKKVDIIAPNLDTFWFCGKKSTPCKVGLQGCNDSLKNLTIEHPLVSRDFCKNQFSRFSLLEKLDLCIFDKTKSFTIFNRSLQRIALKGGKKLTYAQIHAPKLVSFELKGENMSYFDFTAPLRLTDAKISLASITESKDVEVLDGNKLWFKMVPFIERFGPEGYKLIMHSNKHIIIHEDWSSILYPPLRDLTFEIIKSSACVEDILYGILRTTHPESVSIISSYDSKFHESVYEMIKIKDEDPVCCSYNTSTNKCWRHFLKGVKFESWKEMLDVMGASEDESANRLYLWLQSSYTPTSRHQMTNLRLSWNSHEPDVET
ncbi:putative F-box domain, leucine-rich repeat domain, L domain-containing protein [Medicago truncatula]|uniref:F-box/FBD-like domain protein n=1 Tax=Medicago truncatula TaxID=3880 RepID=G7IHX2_MEDTR|nr:putative FBD-associated F-box protein At5g56560 [Medicago truncatula]AES67901.1 F-box/FBD-like domain protein [Medicago truncatula]RHN76319.1 putative F-box domain, leucine-rich repeat domain, L domain-containing protein [Medicago truncatula]